MPDSKQTQGCPTCFLQVRIEEPLIIQPGSRAFPYCNRGHEFPDQEDLQKLMMEAFPRKIVSPPPRITSTPVQPLDGRALKIPPPGPRTEMQDGGAPDPQIAAPPIQDDGSILIDKINFSRLSGILGHFTDASSLFGALFALQSELLDTKELLTRAEAAKKISEGPRKLGGDEVIQIVIPERHVQSVLTQAEANSLDTARYMSSVVEHGLDSGWFFAIMVAIGGSFIWQLVRDASEMILI